MDTLNDISVNPFIGTNIITFWRDNVLYAFFFREFTELLLEPEKLVLVLRSGASWATARKYANSIMIRCLSLVVQNSLITVCGLSESEFMSVSGSLSVTYPVIQEYLFQQLFAAKFLTAILKRCIPRFTHSLLTPVGGSKGIGLTCLKFFNAVYYKKGSLYSTLALGMVHDFSLIITDGAMAMQYFLSLKTAGTSKSRIFKKMVRFGTSTAVQLLLSYASRAFGAMLAMRYGNGKQSLDTSRIFYFQSASGLIMRLPISVCCYYLDERMSSLLEHFLPATAADNEEDDRERLQHEEEQQRRLEAETKGGEGKDSFYDTLGVPMDADQTTIRQKYRSLSLMYHPDRVPRDPDAQREAEAKMVAINEAYETLKNPDLRAAYDLSRGENESRFFGMSPDEIGTFLNQYPSSVKTIIALFGAVSSSFALGLTVYTHGYSLFRRYTPPGSGIVM